MVISVLDGRREKLRESSPDFRRYPWALVKARADLKVAVCHSVYGQMPGRNYICAKNGGNLSADNCIWTFVAFELGYINQSDRFVISNKC